MLDGSAEHLINDRGQAPHLSFAASHRATAACARELAHIEDTVVASAQVICANSDVKKAVIHRSPGRCIVQLGPVAVTLAWLKSGMGTVADGELLVVVWRGQVGPRPSTDYARMTGPAPESSATALWEQVLVVSAESESEWRWRPQGTTDAAVSSASIAERIVQHVQSAWADAARAS